jgi:hypothetical protein
MFIWIIFTHNDRYYHLQKHRALILNHPVYSSIIADQLRCFFMLALKLNVTIELEYSRCVVLYTNSTEQSPSSEADSRSVNHERQCLLYKQQVAHKSSLLIPNMSQINSDYTFSFYLFHFYIIPSMPRSYDWPLSFRYSKQKLCTQF